MSVYETIRHIFLDILFKTIQIVISPILWFIYGGPGEKLPPINDMLLLDSATTLAYKIRTKKIKSVDAVQSFIDRIKEINKILNCVVDERFEEALQTAKEVDEYLQTTTDSVEGIARNKPFLGVPFSAKNCMAVKNFIFTVGIPNRRDFKAAEDAEVVAGMRRAGAIPLVLTNVPELCMWWETNNQLHGRTKNPYNTNRIPGGSSGGEGSILAAGGSPMGIGTDIGGSVRIPGFFCGVFAHKPSTRMVSSKGFHPVPTNEEHQSFLTIGPMTRFAEDLLPLVKIFVGTNVDLLKLDEKVDVKKLKYYYMEDDGGSLFQSPVDEEIKNLVRKSVSYLDETHSIKAQKLNIKKMKRSAAIWFAKMKAESESKMPEQLTDNQGRVNIFLEPFKILFGKSDHTMSLMLMCFIERYGFVYGSEEHSELLKMCDELRVELEDILGEDGVLIYPTHPTAALYHHEPLFKPFNFSYTGIFNVLGFPGTHCPMGLNSNGLPIGLQVLATRNKDRLTMAVAVELEKAFGGWVPPSP